MSPPYEVAGSSDDVVDADGGIVGPDNRVSHLHGRNDLHLIQMEHDEVSNLAAPKAVDRYANLYMYIFAYKRTSTSMNTHK